MGQINLGIAGTLETQLLDLNHQPTHLYDGLVPSSIPASWRISGDARTRSKVLGKTQDKLAYLMLWECGATRFKWHYGKDEFLIVISGEAFMDLGNGAERRFGPSDVGFFPAGTNAVWRVPDHVRKIAVMKRSITEPAAFLVRAWMKFLVLSGIVNESGL